MFGSFVLGALRGGLKPLNSYWCDREFVFCPCSFGGWGVSSPFLPIMFSRNKRYRELHWTVIQWKRAIKDVLEDQGQVGTALVRCPCSWQEGIGTGWFLRCLPTQTMNLCFRVFVTPQSLGALAHLEARAWGARAGNHWRWNQLLDKTLPVKSWPCLSHHAAEPRAQCPFHRVTGLSCSQPLQQPHGLEGLPHV